MAHNDMNVPVLETDRLRAREDTGHSFIVEASAGTGKTRTLIDRILQLVLVKGPAGTPLRLHEICAITFTEKAAGEMKLRLRQNFQQILAEQAHPSDQLDNALLALSDLESASISTFHSFGVSLLKEHPIEAGLDPHFTALNEIQSELFFRKVWEQWVGRALAERHTIIEKALRNGFHLKSLEGLARTLRSKWLTVRDLPCDPPPTEDQLAATVREYQQEGRSYLEQSLKSEDKLAGYLGDALNWLECPGEDRCEIKKPGNAGSAANWDKGKDTVAAVRNYIRDIVEFRTSYLNLPAQHLLNEIVTWVKEDFLRGEWEVRKHAGGLLDFDDQLRLAHDLLRNPVVRRECLNRYKALLVDEFQDTDSIQWHIVLLLTSPNIEGKGSPRLQPVSGLKPGPGRLFIVGDPKQSIYRFRNADIETYLDIVDEPNREALGLQRLKLKKNFRSVPSILHFVDAAFGPIMSSSESGRRYQQEYLAFGEDGARKELSDLSAVHLLGDLCDEEGSKRTSREFLQLESTRIAGLIRRIHGSEEWKVQDSATGVGKGVHPPNYGDIAILLPVLTHANILEEALRDRDIPYVLEGGKFYYARSEVSSAITVLRAVANPNDRVALYGSLKSIFFGLSDEDLLRAHVEEQSLDYRVPVPPDSVLYRPFEILKDLHRRRHERRASETFEVLLQETGAREVLAVRGFQSLANLNKLGRTLRSLQGDTVFSQVVDLLGMMDEEALAESESRLMEERSDAVRVMSIHKAKGLDFPIVFVAALGAQKKARRENLLADPHVKKVFALSIGSRDRRLQTTSWEELSEEEKKKDEAELARLLYVGLTRARDHMILSTHTAGWKKHKETEQWVPAVEQTRLKPLGPFLEECYSGQYELVRWIDADSLDSAAGVSKAEQLSNLPNWKDVVEREYEALRLLREATPFAEGLKATGKDPDVADTETTGKRAVRLGIAFHEAMERVDFLDPDFSEKHIQKIATRHKLDPKSRIVLAEMMQASLASELLQRATAALRSGRRVLRELPYARALDTATVEEGKIDLLFEEKNGWVLVDFKTDRLQEETEETDAVYREKYDDQVRGYADALVGFSVKLESAYLLLARTGRSIRMI